MNMTRQDRGRFAVLCLLTGIDAAFVGCGPSPTPEPSTWPAVYFLPELYAGGQTVPAAVSTDGKVVVGYCGEAAEDGRQQAFRWTKDGGMVGLGWLSGYEDGSCAVATNTDGSIVVGLSSNATTETAAAWVWTAETGMRAIPVPEGTIGSEANDVADDGTVVGAYTQRQDDGTLWQAPFLWSQANGFLSLDGWGGDPDLATMLPAAIAADGFSLVLDRRESDAVDASGVTRGAWVAQFGGPFGQGLWAQYGVTPEDASTFYPTNGSCSDGATTLGGFVTNSSDWVRPAVWTAAGGILPIAPGVTGRVWCVSPDGTMAGGGNGDAGTAFVWSPTLGFQNLIVFLEELDWLHGTDVVSAFAANGGYPSNVHGIADGNKRLVGTAGTSIFGNPCRGFVLDLP